MDVSLIITRNYEKKIKQELSKNKPNQSQLPTVISPKTCAWGDFPLGSGEQL